MRSTSPCHSLTLLPCHPLLAEYNPRVITRGAQDGFRRISDEDFLAQCRLEAFRGDGPGGQKRNKTSSAVRLTHLPTGLSAEATERRSQAQNRAEALRRLRLRVVLEVRVAQDAETRRPGDAERGEAASVPAWFGDVLRRVGRLSAIGRNDPDYLPVAGLVLDVLAECGWSISAAAGRLGLTSAAVSSFLANEERLWGFVNDQRRAAGLKGLLMRRG